MSQMVSDIQRQARNRVLRIILEESSNFSALHRKMSHLKDVELLVAAMQVALKEVKRVKVTLEDAITDMGYSPD